MLKHWYLSLLVIVLVATACTSPAAVTPPAPAQTKGPAAVAIQGWQKEWDDTFAAARKEGELLVFTTLGSESRSDLTRAVREKFGIKLEFVTGRGEELAKRLFTERRAGIFTADLLIAGDTTLIVVMKPEGVLESFEPLLFVPEAKDGSKWRGGKLPFLDSDKLAFAMIASAQRYALRNTDMVKEGEITSYLDLLDPKWKGKLALRDPTITGTGNALMTHLVADIWDLERTKQWMRDIIKQEPAITRDARMQVEWVARGKYPVGIATRIEDTSNFIKEGAPVMTIKFKEGVKVGPGSGSLAKLSRSPHPNATKLFINWILTREGQSTFVKGFGNPSARTDAATEGVNPIFFVDPGEKVFFDTEQSVLMRERIMEVSKEIFGPLLK